MTEEKYVRLHGVGKADPKRFDALKKALRYCDFTVTKTYPDGRVRFRFKEREEEP